MPPKQTDVVYDGGQPSSHRWGEVSAVKETRPDYPSARGRAGLVYSVGDSMRSLFPGSVGGGPNPALSSPGPEPTPAAPSNAPPDAAGTSGGGDKSAQDLSRVFLLLLRPQDKIFELVQIEPPSGATLRDLLDMVPGRATEPRLGDQRHVGLCRPSDGVEFTDLGLPASRSLLFPGSINGDDGRWGEVLVAIPEGYTSRKCRQLSDKILRNPKMIKLLRRRDPLSPRARRSRGRSPTSSSRRRSSPSGRSRSGLTSVPPTVMEHEEENHDEDGDMDTIATLMSRDTLAERRRREEEDKVRREAGERARKEAEEQARRETEERIRREIADRVKERKAEEREREIKERERQVEKDRVRQITEIERTNQMGRRAQEQKTWGEAGPPSPLKKIVFRAVSDTISEIHQDDHLSALESPMAGGKTGGKSGSLADGFAMFVFGMISSASIVLLAMRIIASQTYQGLPPHVLPSIDTIAEEKEPFQQPTTGPYFLLQFAAAFFLLNKAQKRIRRMQRKAQPLCTIRKSNSVVSLSTYSPSGMRRNLSSTSLASLSSPTRRRNTSAGSVVSMPAQRVDYGYGSRRSSKAVGWRQAANL